ncbi:MAG: DISARM system SNF2-like helicase DrmD [Desulfomonilaceae bacterium]
MNQSVPLPGQLVRVRHRHFVVNEVQASALPVNPLKDPLKKPQNLVWLSSVEDDAGESDELQVIWEIEPGAVVRDRIDLPEPIGFDSPARMDAFLDAVRWGAVSSADVRSLQSPFRSGIEIEDYQLDPLVRALQMPRVSLLVADDVGLGKTIETGLVVQELIIRQRVHSVLIVCPASIQIQWRDQMRDKFGLEFRIVDSKLIADLRRRRGLHVNPWTHFPRLITSIDFLKREKPLRRFRETLPPDDAPKYPRRYDMLVIDEAHNIAPSGRGVYATDSQRTHAIREIIPHFEHRIFLTATPHNGYPESFRSLLELVDNRRFSRGIEPDEKQLRAVMVRRMKSELPERWDGTPRFPKRLVEPLEVDYSPEERVAHENLKRYTQLRGRNCASEPEKFASDFVLKLLKKRLFSSPAAFLATLEKHERSLNLAARKSGKLSSQSIGLLRRRVEGIEDDYADDDQYEESSNEVIEIASRFFRELTSEERSLLNDLKRFARHFSDTTDSKAICLIKWLQRNIKPDNRWSDERVLIFTEYRATQKWLQGILAAHGLATGERLQTIFGGMSTEETEKIKAAFQASPKDSPIRILLATDCASEGVDLQNHCSKLIHYEIPWNPNRMEQRNGRLDRHGQRAKEVSVFHFVGKGYKSQRTGETVSGHDLDGDLEFLMKAVEKVNTIREDLGKVGPVIARQVEEAMLGTRRTLETTKEEQDAKPIRRMLSFERDLRDRIKRLHDQLDETKATLRISPENVQRAVETALELAGQPGLKPVIVPDLDVPAFEMPALTGSWAACSEGLAHPHTHKRRPIVFDHNLAIGRDDVALAHMNHRLVQMSLRLLRAEVWSQEDRMKMYRVSARLAVDDRLRDPSVFAFARIVVLGGDNQKLHEEIIEAGGAIREGRFNRYNVTETRNALESASDKDAPQHIKDRLSDMWPKLADPLRRALDARKNDRSNALEKFLLERRDKEINDISTILKELESAIKKELVREPDQQLALWPEVEANQYRRDRDALKRRLVKIPEELEAETLAINARYANCTSRLFPVAVTFVVPKGL